MKTSRIVLFLLGAALIILPAQIAWADDATTPATGSTTTPPASTGDKDARLQKMKAALAQLDLTDDQKAKIKNIFTSMPAGKERRQAIVAVLTPEQKEKLKSMIQEKREAGGATETSAAN